MEKHISRKAAKGLILLLTALALLASCKPDDPDVGPVVPEGAVDMGIVMTREDGTTYKLYWAESNLCDNGLCKNPEDLGDYYAWGETRAKNEYDWDSYIWCNGDNNKLTRYCPKDRTDYWDGAGNPDNKTEFKDYGYSDDAAHAILRGKWRMPTRAEWASLCDQCTWTWINVNGVLGYQVTAANGNSIFIPAAGFRSEAKTSEVGASANYWSSTADTEYPDYAWYLFTKKDRYVGEYHSSRYYGHSIRPVAEE